MIALAPPRPRVPKCVKGLAIVGPNAHSGTLIYVSNYAFVHAREGERR